MGYRAGSAGVYGHVYILKSWHQRTYFMRVFKRVLSYYNIKKYINKKTKKERIEKKVEVQLLCSFDAIFGGDKHGSTHRHLSHYSIGLPMYGCLNCIKYVFSTK